MAIAENWYIILELEFDPNPVVDEAVIEARIEEKRKEWSKQATHPIKGATYKHYVESVKNIKKDMIGDYNIRAELIADACSKTYGGIDDELKALGVTAISPEAVANIAKELKVDAKMVEARAKKLGIKIDASAGGAANSKEDDDLYKKYYETEPEGTRKYTEDSKTLGEKNSPFENFKDLYDFLFEGEGMPKNEMQKLSCSDLQSRAAKKKGAYVKTDAISTKGSRLCTFAQAVFANDAEKAKYDAFLLFKNRKEILDRIEKNYKMLGQYSEKAHEDAVKNLTQVLKDRNLSEKIITAFCHKKGIALPVAPKNAGPQKMLKVCRCGMTNDVTDGRKKCASCGKDLVIACPQCGAQNDASVKFCKCGFSFDNIDKSYASLSLAKAALKAMDFAIAEKHLADAGKFWKTNPDIAAIKRDLEDTKAVIGNKITILKDACRKKMYIEARKQLQEIKKIAATFSDVSLEEEIKSAIQAAEENKKKAETATNEAVIIDACNKAYEFCKDFPGIKEIIAKHPPKAPTNLVASADGKLHKNAISWTAAPDSAGMYYIVRRKEGAIPISPEDGVEIGRVSMNSIADANIQPGVQYFYAVFAERAGIYSPALATTTPVCNLFEVEGVRVTSGDKSLQISWKDFSNIANVQVERIENGMPVKLTCNSRTSFIDKNLENEKEYRYQISLVYQVGTQQLKTPGVTVSGKPTEPFLPIDDAFVKLLPNDSFEITWKNPDKIQVEFFYSANKPKLDYGELIPVSELEKTMQPLMLKKTSDLSGTFTVDGDGMIYILPVAVKAGTGMIGTIVRANKGGAVKITNATLVNDDIVIGIQAPKDASAFVVVYREDRYPELSDTTAVRRVIPFRQYQYDSALKIPYMGPKSYYISVYAEFRVDGEKDYSAAADYLFTNAEKDTITYEMSASKSLLGGMTLSITFSSDKPHFHLPEIMVGSQIGAAPMFRRSATCEDTIEEQEVRGTYTAKVSLGKNVPKNTFVKPFLANDSDGNSYVLKMKPGTSLKVN